MKRFPLTVMAIALVFFTSGCLNADGDEPQAQPPANQPAAEQPAGQTGAYDATAAETAFKNNCAGCHGQNLEGIAGPNLQKVGGKYSKEQIEQILANGKGTMPGGLVKGSDAENIAAWLADKK
jgi:cytochrome c551